MNLYNISDSARKIIMNDCIANNYGPVWDLIRKVPHHFDGYGEPPEGLDVKQVSKETIFFINPLNNKILEIWYDGEHWVMGCNFIEHYDGECIVRIDSLTNGGLAALLPYSGWTIDGYNDDDLPF